MQTFINLFLTPLIALSVRHRRNGSSIHSLDMALIAEYGSLAVCLYILCTLIAKLLSTMLYLGTPTDSFRYTLVATVVSFLLPYIEEIIRKCFSICCLIRPKKTGDKAE